jgi:type VI secretion system secreted protein Hcp
MAIDTWIKFDGIDGEATHKDHKGEIELLSWSWGLTNERPATGGGGAGTGKAKAQDLLIVHRYDKASPVLARKAITGVHLPAAVLSARKAGQGQKDFLKITMKEVFITSVSMADNGDGPVEQVALSFNQIGFAYTPQTASGSAGGTVKVDWNIKTSKVT